MATLEKIRSHGALLVSIIAIAMFAFIIGDFLSSGSTYFNRRKEYVGSVEGHKIHYTDYEAAKNQIEEVYKMETGRTDMDEDVLDNLRNQAWQMMVSDYTLENAAKQIGMTITADELSDICVGNHISQGITGRRMFADENGQFSRANLLNFMQFINMDADEAQEHGIPYAQIEQYRSYWKYWENAVRVDYMQQKYLQLVGHCVTANKLDAQYAFEAGKASCNVEFVGKNYFAVADSLVSVSKSDMKAVYAQNQKMYKQEPNRAIKYISFEVVPSEADFQREQQRLTELREEFATTEDVLTIVSVNSDVPYSAINLSEEQVPEYLREFAFGKGAKAGDVTEIEFDAASNTYYIARLMEAGYSMTDSVRLALVSEEGEEQEIGWMTESMMGEEVAAKALTGAKNSTFTIPAGDKEQVVKILEKSGASPKVKLAILARQVTASSATYATIYNEAKQFLINNNTEEKFLAAAEEAGMQVLPATNLQKITNKVADLKQSRPIVRWAFEAKTGEVSDVFECGQQFIVATLTEIHNDEYRQMNEVEAEVRYEALRDKKAEYLQAKLKDAKTLEEAAAVLGEEIQSAEGINFSSYAFGAAGVEPALVGAALALEQGATSAPVKGMQGVYVVRVNEKTISDAEYDEAATIQQLNMRTSYMLQRMVINELMENADVTDNRPNFQ